jgi:Fe-S-cluster containining protein
MKGQGSDKTPMTEAVVSNHADGAEGGTTTSAPGHGADPRVLRKHRLTYLPQLRLSDELLKVRFRADCSMSNCGAECCAGGAALDILERDRILLHADLVRKEMDDNQEHAVDRWFEDVDADGDFPSGYASATRVHNDRCVFLNAAGRCVLQTAEAAMPDKTTLKPFYCRAFPICIDHGVLSYDDHTGVKPPCCGPVPDGNLSIFDVCEFELEHVLGPEGAAELRELADPSSQKRST